MKKTLLTLSLAASVAFFLTGCTKNTPKDVAKEWLTDFYHQDYESAKKLSTEPTKAMMTTLQGFTNVLPDSIKQKAKAVSINILSVKEEGNTATVTFNTTDDQKEQPPLKLVKQNDKWLVQFTKADVRADDKGMGGPEQMPAQAPATDAPMTTPDTALPKQAQ